MLKNEFDFFLCDKYFIFSLSLSQYEFSGWFSHYQNINCCVWNISLNIPKVQWKLKILITIYHEEQKKCKNFDWLRYIFIIWFNCYFYCTNIIMICSLMEWNLIFRIAMKYFNYYQSVCNFAWVSLVNGHHLMVSIRNWIWLYCPSVFQETFPLYYM